MDTKKELKPLNSWGLFDIWYQTELEKLERAAWNCKGTFGGYIPPFPADIIRQKAFQKMIEFQERQIYELMGVPIELQG